VAANLKYISLNSALNQEVTTASAGWTDRLPVVGKSQGVPLTGCPLSNGRGRPKGVVVPGDFTARRAPGSLPGALSIESDPGEPGPEGRAGGSAPNRPKGDGSTSFNTSPLSVEIDPKRPTGPKLDKSGFASVDPGSHTRPGPKGEVCGGWWAYQCRDCRKTVYYYKGCRDRITCSDCRRKYMEKTFARFSPVVKSMVGTLRFITLTVKNGMDLKERRNHLRKSFRKLRQRVAWKRVVKGGVYAEETTFGKGGWHSHVHIIASGKYFPQDELTKLWASCTGDSVIVDIRKITSTKEACKELMKYCLKDAGLPDERLEEARLAFKRARLVGTFGNLYGSERDEEKDAGEEDGMECPYCGSNDLYRHKPFSWIPRGPPDVNMAPVYDRVGKYTPGQPGVLLALGNQHKGAI